MDRQQRSKEMSVSDVGAGLYCCESVLVAGAVLGSAGPGPLSLSPPAGGFQRLPNPPCLSAALSGRQGTPSWIRSPAARRPTRDQLARLAAWKYFNVNCNSMKIGTTRSAPFPSFPSRCPRPAEPPQCRCHASFCILSACLHRPSGGLKSL